jgi:hypothetical protein
MHTPHDIEQALTRATPTLTDAERGLLWERVQDALPHQSVPSPFLFGFVTRRSMPILALALVLTLGLGTTAAASQDARPGDLLFPVDRALEQARLALTRNDEKRAELHIALAEERLEELRSLLADDDATAPAASTTVTATFEADVFTDITIVTVEINDRKSTFTTDADTRAEVVAEIASRYSITESQVEATLDFEVEDRASRINDIADTNRNNERIATSVTLLASLVENIDDDARTRFVDELHAALERRSDARIEMRTDDERVRVRIDDGEVRVDTRSKDDDDNDRDDERTNDDSSAQSFEAEADVFTDITIVTVEINDRKSTFTTDADTRAEVVAEIASRYSITESQVEATLDFEVEDRASRTDDADSNDGGDDTERGIEKIEVRVENGIAEVRMEYDDKKLEFEIPYITRAALITTLAVRSGLLTTDIEQHLDLEIED